MYVNDNLVKMLYKRHLYVLFVVKLTKFSVDRYAGMLYNLVSKGNALPLH